MISLDEACRIAVENLVKSGHLKGIVGILDIGGEWLFLARYLKNLGRNMGIVLMQSVKKLGHVKNFRFLLWKILISTIKVSLWKFPKGIGLKQITQHPNSRLFILRKCKDVQMRQKKSVRKQHKTSKQDTFGNRIPEVFFHAFPRHTPRLMTSIGETACGSFKSVWKK